MKLNQQKTSTHPLTSEDEYLTQIALERKRENGPKTRAYFIGNQLVFAPHPPTAEAVKRAQFVDKTYQWTRN